MTSFMNTLHLSHLGYAAIFLCVGIGFFLIKLVAKEENGPGLWGLSFLCNSIGFTLWSGIIPIELWQYYLIGELFHMSGFILFVGGVYRFTEGSFKRWNTIALAVFVALWILMLILYPHWNIAAIFGLRILRAALFMFSGIHLLVRLPPHETSGRKLAGTSQILWAVYMLIYGAFQSTKYYDFVFGLLVGFQILAAFGLVVMIVDRIHLRAAKTERRVNQLETLLPICAHCRRIHGKDDSWYNIETYIENNTASQFSHGICPDCMKRYFPLYLKK